MDYDFRKALAADPGSITFAGQVLSRGREDIVAYWQHEKREYALWELLLYMGKHMVPQTLTYFDLPADTVPFCAGSTITSRTSSASKSKRWPKDSSAPGLTR